MARVATSKISIPTPGSSQNQPAQGVPLTAPMIPPTIIHPDATTPTYVAVIAIDVPESDIIKLGIKVIIPRIQPTLTTAMRLTTVFTNTIRLGILEVSASTASITPSVTDNDVGVVRGSRDEYVIASYDERWLQL